MTGTARPASLRLTERAHRWLATCLGPGDLALDATAGNGHDTLFLALAVGPTGCVVALDVQQVAVDATERRLAAFEGPRAPVELHLGDHGDLPRFLGGRRARAAVFNLGYLPGGARPVTTVAERTLEGLRCALAALEDGGLLSVLAYPGHPGGRGETALVIAWCRRQCAEDRAAMVVRERGPSPDSPRLCILRAVATPKARTLGLSSREA